MSDAIEKLMLANLLAVFNERDDDKRRLTIDETYSAEVHWTDAEGITTGRAALDSKCIGLQTDLGNQQFAAAGPVHQLPGFGYLAWHLLDSDSGEPVMSGFDTALVKDGLITDLWTVLTPPQQ